MDDLVSSGCLLSRKIWWTVQIGSFCPNFFGEFVGQDGLKEGLHENEFDYFQIQKWKLQIVRAEKEKVDEKRGYLSSFHVFFMSFGP